MVIALGYKTNFASAASLIFLKLKITVKNLNLGQSSLKKQIPLKIFSKILFLIIGIYQFWKSSELEWAYAIQIVTILALTSESAGWRLRDFLTLWPRQFEPPKQKVLDSPWMMLSIFIPYNFDTRPESTSNISRVKKSLVSFLYFW